MVKITCSCRRKQATESIEPKAPSSLLDIKDKEPLRFKPLIDASLSLRNKALALSRLASSTFLKMNQAFWDMMGVESALLRLQNASLIDVAKVTAPYALTYGFFICEERYLQHSSGLDTMKLMMSFMFLGYVFSQRITEKNVMSLSFKVLMQACTFFTFIGLHKMFYDYAHLASDKIFSSFEKDRYITLESKDNFNILLSLISSFALLPKLVLLYEELIRSSKLKFEQTHGLKTQSSRLAKIPTGSISEANFILNVYDHFTAQLHDPSRLFQYFIVSMNVLRDQQLQDPLSIEPPIIKKGLSYTLNKTRNCWLLLIDSIAKAKADLEVRSLQLEHDNTINNEEYTVIRLGKTLSHVKRFDLQVGDLITLDQTIDTIIDPTNGHSRHKAKLCGYIVALKPEDLNRKIAISLVELNGENHSVIIKPSLEIKTKALCQDVDLFSLPLTGAILPGTEFISFDTEKHEAQPRGLYLQIARPQARKEPFSEKKPLSHRQIKALKDKLIYQTLFLSIVSALPLMRFSYIPSSLKKGIQFYGTEFIDKFTQVFSETQQMIPLVSEMALEMVNTSLLKEINSKLASKITLNQSLLVADLFEALSKQNVRILSDKTGTVTETFMRVKNIVLNSSIQDLAIAFASTFSDQKTEAEENEIKDFLENTHHIVIEAEANGPYGHFEKRITFGEGLEITFNTKKLGLFTDFGGQFTLQEREDMPPVVVFCGIPKGSSTVQPYFQDTAIFTQYAAYEAHEHDNAIMRMDSLTRDWCIAEAEISAANHTLLLEALSDRCNETSKAKMKDVFHVIRNDFVFLGVFQIDNPIKKDAAKTIKAWKAASIDFTLITGDTKNAAKMIALKLYGSTLDQVIESTNWSSLTKLDDYSQFTCVFTDISEASIKLYQSLLKLGSKKPWIIFAQMKEADKKVIAERAKDQKAFVVASGDGCNDIMMFNSAHLAIASSATDGSFARGLQDASSITDIQIRQLLEKPGKSLYELFDIHLGKDSVFLKHFARMANSQPKVITSLLGKSLKSMAIPRLLGKYTREIPGQFGVLLAYDAAFLGSVYHKVLDSAHVPLMKESIKTSYLPYCVLITAVVIAALESLYAYSYHDRQILNLPLLAVNLGFSIGCLSLFLAPPGFKKQET